MNITLLHTLCIKIRREAAINFKNEIENSIFPLNDEIIQISIDTMKQAIGQKVRSKIYNDYFISDAQELIIKSTIKNYTSVVVNKGWRFAKQKEVEYNNLLNA